MTQRSLCRSLVVAIAVVLLLSACNGSSIFGDGIKGSGELVTERFDVDDFDAIEVSNTFDAFVTVGQEFSVEVLADENLIDELDVRVRNSTLLVALRDGVSINSGTLEATIRIPELVSLDVSGASSAEVVGSSGADQRFEVSGASELDVTGASGALTILVSGSSDVRMDGTATEVTIEATGASDTSLDLRGIGEAIVDLSGASSVKLESADSVTGSIAGASDLTVPAEARVEVDSSGAGDVRRS